MNNRNRIVQLDGLRLFMCLSIVITHLEFLSFSSAGEFYSTYLMHSVLAVDYFFILSGFGIYYSLHDKEVNCSIKESIKFAIKKIYKIYPIYIISCLIGMVEWLPTSFIGEHNFNMIIRLLKVLLSFVFCPFLVQSLTGVYSFTHAMNGVCWFLSSLFISYIFCPLFIKIVNKLKNVRKTFIFLVSISIMIVLLTSIAIKLDNMPLFGIIDNLSGTHPFIRCLYLLIGMCISRIIILDKSSISERKVFLFFLIYIIYFFSRNVIISKINGLIFNTEIINLIDVVLTSLLIYVCVCGKGKIIDFLSQEKIIYYSNYSMYIFLFHFPIRMILIKICEITSFFMYGEWTYAVVILLIIVLTCFLSWICKKYKNNIDHYFIPFLDNLYHLFDK